MKIHITNLYNFNAGDELVKKQHRFADAGRELGFTEMGIFSYPVETDTPSELNKRLDGIVSALEFDNVVFMQLPTRNGFAYENLLFNKIKAYRSKVVFLLHDLEMISDSDKELQEKYISMFRLADAIIAPSVTAAGMLNGYDLNNLLFCDDVATATVANIDNISSLPCIDFYVKKLLMDAVETIFSADIMQQRSNLPASEDEIQIAFGLHDKTGNYAMWVGVTMQSIIEHTSSKICFHILHDKTLLTENKNKLNQIVLPHGHSIAFHFLEDSLFAKYIEQASYFTIGAFFRALLPELLFNLKKIIYLDADILVNRDISELWNIDINNYIMAAVPDFGSTTGRSFPLPVKKKEIDAQRYFNTGVLYLNLYNLRQKGSMKEAMLDYLDKNPDATLPDQDALNSLYNSETLLLDSSWNYFARHVQESGEKTLSKKLYHYAATQIRLYSQTEMDSLYYETICHTPWGPREGRRILSNAFSRTHDRNTQLEKIIRKLCESPKKKIFYGAEDHVMRNLYQLLPINKNDYRILGVPDNNTQNILPCRSFSSLNNEEKNSFIVFVAPNADNNSALSNLDTLGLVNGTDYFVINRLLPPEQGGYI